MGDWSPHTPHAKKLKLILEADASAEGVFENQAVAGIHRGIDERFYVDGKWRNDDRKTGTKREVDGKNASLGADITGEALAIVETEGFAFA